MKLYGIYHAYTVDDGFGDSVYQEDLVTCFPSKELAKAYVAKWSDEYYYSSKRSRSILYDRLYCGILVYKELPEVQEDINTPPESLGKMIPYFRDHSNEEKL